MRKHSPGAAARGKERKGLPRQGNAEDDDDNPLSGDQSQGSRHAARRRGSRGSSSDGGRAGKQNSSAEGKRLPTPDSPLDTLISRIDDCLFLGSVRALATPKLLHDRGITHVVSVLETSIMRPILQAEWWKSCKFHVLAIPVADAPTADLITWFPRVVRFADRAVAKGQGVFFHCQMGVSRSTTALMAYLMWKQRCTAQQAYQQVYARRKVMPNHGFASQLVLWQQMQYNLEGETEAHKTYQSRLDDNDNYLDPAFEGDPMRFFGMAGYPFRAPEVDHSKSY